MKKYKLKKKTEIIVRYSALNLFKFNITNVVNWVRKIIFRSLDLQAVDQIDTAKDI